jgi:hypothetical protein
MFRLWERIGEATAEVIVTIVGWMVCLFILSIAFGLGRWVASYLDWQVSPDTIGMLSALAFLWLYEHRNIQEKYERLREGYTATDVSSNS